MKAFPLIVDNAVLLTFLPLWLAVVPVPGPNTLMVTHVAVTRPARYVVLAILGNMVAIGSLALAAILGWAAALEAFPKIRTVINVLGGAYLVYLGFRLAKQGAHVAASEPGTGHVAENYTARSTFALGFFTAISNAQAIFFITSIFAVAGVIGANLATGLAAIGIIICCNITYCLFLAWLFQRPPVRSFYARSRHWLEAIFGVLFIGFGARLLWREWVR